MIRWPTIAVAVLWAAPAAAAAEMSARPVSADTEEWIVADSGALARYRVVRRDDATYVVEAQQTIALPRPRAAMMRQDR